ncbi:probable glycosyltransferase At5g03795 isoform X2 [Nymphaea colorata]|uniref:probable glycosyltransferase At5g03795 isoform X2 n=1 Tax=Nymphaea colorata TaxID=210225 RepID=UPI00214DF5C0|nr:probable glycosyltransferase At5g03795 isoform X2 [Nymphaea colorata]
MPESLRSFYSLPASLALLSSAFILCYILLTSDFHHRHLPDNSLILEKTAEYLRVNHRESPLPLGSPLNATKQTVLAPSVPLLGFDGSNKQPVAAMEWIVKHKLQKSTKGNDIGNNVFHNKKLFLEDYMEMKERFRIYVYPHKEDDPFANVLLPVKFEPYGNYASESYFKKLLTRSHFITKDPAEADLFFLPFSIARLRHDPRVDVQGIPDFVRSYISYIRRSYPYWNRTDGTDHFYVACHSTGRSAMEKADVSLPQIWPRHGNLPQTTSLQRKRLAFFAGAINSPVRQKLIQEWGNDTEVAVHSGRISSSYADALLQSKFCLHVKGFEVNTARIADAIFHGCVPLLISNHYDLPFADILEWRSFSMIVTTLDIPLLKEVLHEVSPDEYERLQRNVCRVRKHFQWHAEPVDYDAFYMVMYELWLRRSVTRVV